MIPIGIKENTKARINISENYADCIRMLGSDVNKKTTFLPTPLSAMKARFASILWRFVLIISQRNMFSALT